MEIVFLIVPEILIYQYLSPTNCFICWTILPEEQEKVEFNVSEVTACFISCYVLF